MLKFLWAVCRVLANGVVGSVSVGLVLAAALLIAIVLGVVFLWVIEGDFVFAGIYIQNLLRDVNTPAIHDIVMRSIRTGFVLGMAIGTVHLITGKGNNK
jgi:hypothetical protein